MVPFAHCILRRGPTTPTVHRYTDGLGSSPFARHYWGNHSLFSSPQGTKMFQFPWFASVNKNTDNYPSGNWVVPFGNLRIKGHLHLPRAYRSLSRPSSPPRAKASTRRPNLLSPKSRWKVTVKSEQFATATKGLRKHTNTILKGQRQQIPHFPLVPVTLDCSYFQL